MIREKDMSVMGYGGREEAGGAITRWAEVRRNMYRGWVPDGTLNYRYVSYTVHDWWHELLCLSRIRFGLP